MARTAIHLLRAMRAFSDRPVPDEVIRQSVDGGRCAPYAGSLSQRSVHVRRTTPGACAGSAVVVRPRSGTAVSPAEGMGTEVRLVIRHDGAARCRHRVDPRAVLVRDRDRGSAEIVFQLLHRPRPDDRARDPGLLLTPGQGQLAWRAVLLRASASTISSTEKAASVKCFALHSLSSLSRP